MFNTEKKKKLQSLDSLLMLMLLSYFNLILSRDVQRNQRRESLAAATKLQTGRITNMKIHVEHHQQNVESY